MRQTYKSYQLNGRTVEGNVRSDVTRGKEREGEKEGRRQKEVIMVVIVERDMAVTNSRHG